MWAPKPRPHAKRWRRDGSLYLPQHCAKLAARLAGILAAKRTSDLIPLCHPLALSHVDVDFTPEKDGYTIIGRVRTTGRTGVEMEALTAVSVAALTIYDMLKALDKEMVIGDICVTEKRGGKSGEYKRR